LRSADDSSAHAQSAGLLSPLACEAQKTQRNTDGENCFSGELWTGQNAINRAKTLPKISQHA